MIVDVVTPTRKLVQGATAESVVLPGAKGQLEVLPGHAELLTLLDTGILALRSAGGVRQFVVSHGFAEIRDEKVTVLAETAEESHEIDPERARRAQQKAEQELQSSLSKEHFRKYELKLQRAVLRQQIAKPRREQ